MTRVVLATCLTGLCVSFVGCGSSLVGLPGGGDEPGPAGDTVTVGTLEVGVESAAGFKTLPLTSAGPVAFTVMYGTEIVRLQELGRGGRIAFARYDGSDTEIYTMAADGSDVTKLTRNNTNDFHPTWSPDGTKIAFHADRADDDEIFVMNADGSGLTNLTKNSTDDAEPAWSPDGAKIAYRGYDSGWEIFVMNADGSGQTALTSNSLTDDYPAWSPDGRKVAFTTYDGDGEVWVANADGGALTVLTDNSVADYEPAWSPDGSLIAFTGYDGSDTEIYVMGPNGSGKWNRTGNDRQDDAPDWSPDGRKIAFESHDGADQEIYVMNADGSDQTPLTSNSVHDYDPAWCPGPTIKRGLIGAAGSDGGADPPLGASRPLAVVGLTDEGLVSAATVTIHKQSWSTLAVKALPGSTRLAGLRITGAGIKGVRDDMGRGVPVMTWNVKETPATGAVLVFFSVDTGKITTVIASADEPLDSPASGRLTLRGEFTEAYSAADPTRNLITGTAAEIVLDGSGAIVSVH